MTLPEVRGAENSPEVLLKEIVPTAKQLNMLDSESKRTLTNLTTDARARVFSYMATKPASKMVIEAVRAISTEEKSASIPAIMKWVIANYAVFDVDKVKYQVKKAILKALDQGTIERSETSRGSLGASGSFVLSKDSPGKKRAVKSGKVQRRLSKKRNSIEF